MGPLGLFQTECGAKLWLLSIDVWFSLLNADKLRLFGPIGNPAWCFTGSLICHLTNSSVNSSQLVTKCSLETKVLNVKILLSVLKMDGNKESSSVCWEIGGM